MSPFDLLSPWVSAIGWCTEGSQKVIRLLFCRPLLRQAQYKLPQDDKKWNKIIVFWLTTLSSWVFHWEAKCIEGGQWGLRLLFCRPLLRQAQYKLPQDDKKWNKIIVFCLTPFVILSVSLRSEMYRRRANGLRLLSCRPSVIFNITFCHPECQP